MANTYKLISAVTVGSGGTTAINFTSIPQTYTDLVLKLSLRIASQDYLVKYNGTGSNYSATFLYGSGNGGAPSSFRSTVAGYIGFTNDTASEANTFGNNEIYIPSYTVAQAKPINQLGAQERNINTPTYLSETAQLWNNTAAITSIEVTNYTGGTIYEYSTAYLYGISNA
jgi:hypothetical protein